MRLLASFLLFFFINGLCCQTFRVDCVLCFKKKYDLNELGNCNILLISDMNCEPCIDEWITFLNKEKEVAKVTRILVKNSENKFQNMWWRLKLSRCLPTAYLESVEQNERKSLFEELRCYSTPALLVLKKNLPVEYVPYAKLHSIKNGQISSIAIENMTSLNNTHTHTE